MSPEQGFGNTTEPSAEELEQRFQQVHEQIKHGEHEGPDPATGENYQKVTPEASGDKP
jgi:hypothetical protein